MALPEICFAQDTSERRQWFEAASFSHPAKMILGLQIYLIEHYTEVGDTIIDPMAGSGTVLVACALGRNVVCVELEQKFVDMQKANWSKIKALGPMLGYQMGTATIIQGDARQLPELLVDKCIFSPPYAEAHDQNIGGIAKDHPQLERGSYLKTDNPDQISNLPYGEVDAVISSPPYEGTEARDRSKEESFDEEREKKFAGGSAKIAKGYQVDAVISSPPYEGSLQSGKDGIDDSKWTNKSLKSREQARAIPKGYAPKADAILTSPPYEDNKFESSFTPPHDSTNLHKSEYAPTVNNIGNLKSDNYLEAMLQVYRGCHAILKPKGIMCLVTKNFIRDKKLVRLDTDTIKLCEKAGFTLKERLKRKLTQQSFWRIIYQKKFPDAPKIEFEDVLIFGIEFKRVQQMK